ncbi:FAD linked oxidase domain-containing protein [Actinobacillus equuli]|nr:FAD linked oxidase domain-containing protein [Actinobacillus equuli]
MDTCLACKACASQCPIKIDVPTFRSQFNELYHSRYLRPAKDYLVSNLEFVAPMMAKAPKFFNFLVVQISGNAGEQTIGMTYLPALSLPNLQQQLVEIGYQGVTLETLEAQASGQNQRNFAKPCWWCKTRSLRSMMRKWWRILLDCYKNSVFVRLCYRLNRAVRRNISRVFKQVC